jgi:hypothetical protein
MTQANNHATISALPDDVVITSAQLLGAEFGDPIFTWQGAHHYTKDDRPPASVHLPERSKADAARVFLRRASCPVLLPVLRVTHRGNRMTDDELADLTLARLLGADIKQCDHRMFGWKFAPTLVKHRHYSVGWRSELEAARAFLFEHRSGERAIRPPRGETNETIKP